MGLCIHNWNKKIDKQSHFHLFMSNSQLYKKTFQRIFPHKKTGVWMFLPSINCGIGRPKRSLSSSINKGEPIFTWSVQLEPIFTWKCSLLRTITLDFDSNYPIKDHQVFGTWIYRYCVVLKWWSVNFISRSESKRQLSRKVFGTWIYRYCPIFMWSLISWWLNKSVGITEILINFQN